MGIFVIAGFPMMVLMDASVKSVKTGTAPPAASCSATAPYAYEKPFDRKTFCTDPSAAICGPDDVERYLGDRKNLREKYRDRALAAFSSDLGRQTDIDNLIALKENDRKLWLKRHAEYLSKVETLLLSDYGQSKGDLTNAFETAKTQLMATVDRETTISTTARAAMKATLLKTRFKLPSEVFADKNPTILKRCGHDGLRMDAFEYNDAGTPTVVVCPGMLLLGRALQSKISLKEPFLGIFETLSHELGHAIDSDAYPAQLTPFHDCLRDVYGFETKKWKAPFDLMLDSKKIPPGQLAELSADAWAAENVATRIESLGQEAAFAKLREMYRAYCSGDTVWNEKDEHMPDAARLSFLLSTNARIRKQFGCSAPTKAQPSCDVQGRRESEP